MEEERKSAKLIGRKYWDRRSITLMPETVQ